MKNNYLLPALRNVARNKLFSIINIVGLSIGMAATLLMLLWIVNEVSYDRFYTKSDRVYRLMSRFEQKGEIKTTNSFSPDLLPVLKEKYPEIEAATSYFLHYPLITHKEHTKIYTARYVNPDFFSMFDFPFIYGNTETAMLNTQSAVITESMATSVFGFEDPMGKELILDGSEVFTVAGVLKDLPINTELQFEILLPFSDATNGKGAAQSPMAMIELRKGVSQNEVDEKIKDFFRPYLSEEEQQNLKYELFLHPIVKWHLYSNFENGKNVGGKIETVHMIAFLAAFILLTACVNFTTLSTASSEKRAREVGMRKVVGGGKAQLVGQFLGESVMLAFIAGLLAILLAHLFLPWFNTLMGTKLFMPYAASWFWLGMAIFILITGCLAGCYPAFFLSSLPAMQTVKRVAKPSHMKITPRKVLVVFQFSISLLLIIYTSVVNKQLKYAQDRNPGYDKEGLVYFNMRGDLKNPGTYQLFRDEMIANRIAEDVCRTNMPFTSVWGMGRPSWQGKDPEVDTRSIVFCTDGRLATFAGMEMMLGRDFEFDTYAADSSACVINESFLRMTGFTEPLGQIVNVWGTDLHVVGVFRDFIIESPYSPIQPMLISGKQLDDLRVMNIRFNRTLPISEAMASTEQIFKKYNSPIPFDVHFLDYMYERKFSNEQRTSNLSNSASVLAIFISCLGLFALATYMAEKRTKEIAVRKVNGSTIFEIIVLLIKDFLALVAIAAVIAIPIAWYISRQWLDKYAYRTSLDWWLFAGVVLLVAIIAILSVGGQAYKAAKVNPVDSLNRE